MSLSPHFSLINWIIATSLESHFRNNETGKQVYAAVLLTLRLRKAANEEAAGAATGLNFPAKKMGAARGDEEDALVEPLDEFSGEVLVEMLTRRLVT